MSLHPAYSSPVATEEPARTAHASGSVTVLTLEEFVVQLRKLRPPPAYRLSLDSGIEYKNVRLAFEQPFSTRLQTWRKLLNSLRIRMVAARCAEDVIWPGENMLLVGFGAEAATLVDPASTRTLRECRFHHGWSRRELAQRAAVSVDTVTSIENSRGLVCTLAQVCQALDLRLFLALPPRHDSLASVWAERAPCCLERPAHYPAPRQRSSRM